MQFLRWLGKSLVRQILLAMLLGILIGRILFVAELPQAAEYFQILGDFFTKALRAVALKFESKSSVMLLDSQNIG